jgi:hypothetical protein
MSFGIGGIVSLLIVFALVSGVIRVDVIATEAGESLGGTITLVMTGLLGAVMGPRIPESDEAQFSVEIRRRFATDRSSMSSGTIGQSRRERHSSEILVQSQ